MIAEVMRGCNAKADPNLRLFAADPTDAMTTLGVPQVRRAPKHGRVGCRGALSEGRCARARIPLNGQKEGKKHPPKAAGRGYLGV